MKPILIFALIVITAITAQAQNEQNTEMYGTHQHDGFFLSMSLGPNLMSLNDDVNDAKYKHTGTGAQFDLKIGGAINENLILHGTLLSNYIQGPKIEIDGTKYRTTNDLGISEVMVGAGLTYYVMPSNIFLSGSLGIGGFSLTNDEEDIDISTDSGFAFQLKAGKEWWVGKNWGLGVAISYNKTRLTNRPEGSYEEKLNSNNLSIVFNATFN